MNRRWRSRPLGGLFGAVLLATVVSALVVVAPSAAAGPEKTFETNFEAQCVLAPGILDLKGIVKFGVRGEAAERVSSGEEFELHRETITFALPLEWIEGLVSIGAHEVRGRVTHFPLDAEGGTPSRVNDAVNAEFPSGAPFKGPVEKGHESTYVVPSGGGTLVSPPVKLSGSPSGLTMKVDPGSGVKETSPGHFEATEEGIQLEIGGYNESGEEVIGPLKISCTAPSGVVVATATEGPPPPPPCTSPLEFAHITSIEPESGPTTGGTAVTIRGENFVEVSGVTFGGTEAEHFEFPGGHLVAVAPPGTGSVHVEVHARCTNSLFSGNATFTYTETARLEFKNWALAGSLTPKPLDQKISLPAGATFNGEESAGKLTGSLSIPPFVASIKLFGLLPAGIGVKLTQAGALEGSLAINGIGNTELTLLAKLNLGITEFRFLGLRVPLSCTTVEPVAEPVTASAVKAQELLSRVFERVGTTTIPRVTCGGTLGSLLGSLLTMSLSGPEALYVLRYEPPA